MLTSTETLDDFIEEIYPTLELNYEKPDWFRHRAILTPLNEDVLRINEMCLKKLPGEVYTSYGYDTIPYDNNGICETYQDLLPNRYATNFPRQNIELKIGAPIMLLTNLNQKIGACNGTRLIIRGISNHNIRGVITNGNHRGEEILIPKIRMSSEGTNLEIPFTFYRTQFPVRLAFGMTINKAQGQTIENKIGIIRCLRTDNYMLRVPEPPKQKILNFSFKMAICKANSKITKESTLEILYIQSYYCLNNK